MKVLSLGRTATVEYHETEKGDLVTIEAITMHSGIEIVAGDVSYIVRLDDVGALSVRVYGGRVEAMNVSPRSGSEVRIWCEMWKPPSDS
jgi:hypothetical protein